MTALTTNGVQLTDGAFLAAFNAISGEDPQCHRRYGKLFHRAVQEDWKAARIAKLIGWSKPHASRLAKFGAFCASIPAGTDAETAIGDMTEWRFREWWLRSETMAGGKVDKRRRWIVDQILGGKRPWDFKQPNRTGEAYTTNLVEFAAALAECRVVLRHGVEHCKQPEHQRSLTVIQQDFVKMQQLLAKLDEELKCLH